MAMPHIRMGLSLVGLASRSVSSVVSEGIRHPDFAELTACFQRNLRQQIAPDVVVFLTVFAHLFTGFLQGFLVLLNQFHALMKG